MSRLMLLLVMGMWLIGTQVTVQPQPVLLPALGIFFAGYILLVAAVALWARRLSRKLVDRTLHDSLKRFMRVTHIAQWFVPGWMVFGLFGPPAWGHLILSICGREFLLPGMLLGTLPAVLAWIGLWWAEFPADRALREQNLLAALSLDLPVRAPPRLSRYLRTAVRQQLMPVLVLVLLIVLVRDLVKLGSLSLGWTITEQHEDLVLLPAGALVYLASPELLRRILKTQRLEDSPLRRRLELICQRTGVRCRQILLWQTDFSMANAAVIGILPHWRYVLLSDQLLESMADEQVEAVFAHELGHIVHHHLGWMVMFFLAITLNALSFGQILEGWVNGQETIRASLQQYERAWSIAVSATGFILMLVLFGMLSRRFERQADVFAARMLESNWGEARPGLEAIQRRPLGRTQLRRWLRLASHVGPRGAELFCSALLHVAAINNIPFRSRGWFHPSIASRMACLRQMSRSAGQTMRFDRQMNWIFWAIVGFSVLGAALSFLPI